MNDNNNPSQDPSDTRSLVGSIRFALKKFLQNVDDMLPAQVILYEPGPPQFVTAQPLIMKVGTSGNTTANAQYSRVPVLTIGGGGFVIYCPIVIGDIGWIKANDRDISLFIQNGGEAAPQTDNLHSFSDGIFIPNAIRQFVLNKLDVNNLVFQSVDGVSRISIGATKITIAAPIVEIDAPLVSLIGTLAVTGNITATGTITPGS